MRKHQRMLLLLLVLLPLIAACTLSLSCCLHPASANMCARPRLQHTQVLIGMSPGSRVRALIPPELGYTSSVLQPQPPTFATKRQLANHSREPLLFEVELLRVNAQK